MENIYAEKLQSTQPKIKEIKVVTVLTVCEQAITKYNLDELLKKAKIHFKNLTGDEQDLLWAGLIRLGEALTFCRDKKNPSLQSSGILDAAIKLAEARNYFIHHHVYYAFLSSYSKLKDILEGLPMIQSLQQKLQKLKASGLDILTKPIGLGKNDYPFAYSKQVEVLIAEFSQLDELLKSSSSTEKTINQITEVKLNNRIRNILTIMLDLTGESATNTYNSEPCDKEKAKAKEINKDFKTNNAEFANFFRDLKVYRNALSHLDASLKLPYKNVEQMLEFASDLQKINQLGYTDSFKSAFLAPEVNEKEDFFFSNAESR